MARAAVRPAAPVRLGRGGEPPGLISPWRLSPSRDRQAPAPGSMYDPNDDTDVTSGTTDGAQMERASPPVRLDWEANRGTETAETMVVRSVLWLW